METDVSKEGEEIPSEKGKVGYCNPPVEHRIKPGEVRNPNGRPKNAGLSIIETHNWLAEKTQEEIEAIAADKSLPMVKRVTAMRWISALTLGKDGRDELAEIGDRTHGKPTQSMDVTSGGQPIKSYMQVSPDDWDKPKPEADRNV